MQDEIMRQVRQITRENEKLFQQLLDGEKRFRGLAKAVWKVQEEERRRLARELHDGIGQVLTALKNQLEYLAGSADEDGNVASAGVREAVDLASHALEETRELSRLLRPPVLDDLGLESALTWLARVLKQRTGLEVRLELRGLETRLEPDLETLVFRVIQEGLTNAIKHSGAEWARVVVVRTEDRLSLLIEDEGDGFDSAKVLSVSDETTGLGLRGIHDRVELFGGRVDIRSRVTEGTSLQIDLPARGSATAAV